MMSLADDTPASVPVPFVHLHTHSQFSLLEASSRIEDMVATAKAQGAPAVALTDTGNLYGAVAFYTQAKAAGLNPIVGVELAVVDGDYTDRSSKQPTYNVVLLCQNWQGYQHLVKLVSLAHTEGFYYRPRINWALLAQYAEGLVCLTDCLHGPLGYQVLRGYANKAQERLQWLKATFGERLFVELQDHGTGPELQVIAELVRLAQEEKVPLVLTNDTRFTHAGQEQVVDILLCMQQGTTLKDPNRRQRFGPAYYMKSGEEMLALFPHLPREVVAQAAANTLNVAELCQLQWPMGESILPQYPLPQGKTEDAYLRDLSYTQAKAYYPVNEAGELPPHVVERLEFELGIIANMGFPAYFLIVWDFIDYAKRQGIPVGPGRGSAAGSLIAYVLGITGLCPLEHNLLFERFLNPERVSMPDIDIDFCIERRGEVIEYVNQRYGTERVCQIATFGTLAARAALKAVGRVLEMPFEESNRLSKMIPALPGTKLKEALEEGMELQREYAASPVVKEWVDLALQLEGLACNVGTHAAGVVISKDPLDEVIALQHSKDGQLISQFTMGDLEKLGLLKMDFLGLRNLTIIHHTLEHLKQEEGDLPPLNMDHLNLEDPAVYELLTAGDTDGVFQLESGGMKQLMRDLKPNTFEDINALVALYRPGPLNSGMAKSFVDRKHGREAVDYPHPSLEPILKPTYGTIVYQEQIMQIAQVLAGYSLGQADLLRRAMGKKKAEVMAKEREGFVAGATANGVHEDLANSLFDTMSEFAAYCFNRSHSAAYALLAFQTAYLKAHHPVAYLAALLSSVRDNQDKLQHYLVMGRRMAIAVRPPCVQHSSLDFKPVHAANEGEGQHIRFGLASIKGIGQAAAQSLLDARAKDGAFRGLEDFLKRVDGKVLNRKALEALILCGALSSFGYSRRHLLHNLEAMVRFAEEASHRASTGQASLFDLMATSGGEADEASAGASALHFSGDGALEFPEEELQRYEKELLGFYLTSHPLDGIKTKLPLCITHTLLELAEQEDNTEVRVGGLITSATLRMSRKNKPLLVGTLEDFTATREFIAFGDAVDRLRPVLVEGQRVLLKARLSFKSDEEDSSFSLIGIEAQPLAELEPLVLTFSAPPSYEVLVHLASVLRQHAPAKAEPKARSHSFGRPADKATGPVVPVVLRWGGQAQPWQVGAGFWVSPGQLPALRHQLGQLPQLVVS